METNNQDKHRLRVEAATRVVDAVEQGIKNLRASGFVRMSEVAEVILRRQGKVVVAGVGKSGIVAHKFAASLASNGTPAVFMNAAEALHGDLGLVCQGDVVILISNSGATDEILRLIPSLKKIGVTMVGIVNREKSILESEADYTIQVPIPSEGDGLGLAPMCSSTIALIVSDALVAMLQGETGFSSEEFAVFHPGGSLGRSLLMTAGDVMVPASQVGKVSLDASFQDVVSQLTSFSLGIIVVEDSAGQLAGVISDGDVRRTVLFEQYDQTAKEIMSVDPIVMSSEIKLGAVLALMENPNQRISAAPVVEGRRVLGVVRIHDVLGSGPEGR